MELPFIAKETSGRGGKQVFLIEHADDLAQLNDGNWIVQKPGLFGRDIRVFVVGNKVKAAVLRSPLPVSRQIIRWADRLRYMS